MNKVHVLWGTTDPPTLQANPCTRGNEVAANSPCLTEEEEEFDSIQSCFDKQTWYHRQHLCLRILHDAISVQISGILKNQLTEPERQRDRQEGLAQLLAMAIATVVLAVVNIDTYLQGSHGLDVYLLLGIRSCRDLKAVVLPFVITCQLSGTGSHSSLHTLCLCCSIVMRTCCQCSSFLIACISNIRCLSHNLDSAYHYCWHTSHCTDLGTATHMAKQHPFMESTLADYIQKSHRPTVRATYATTK